MEETGKKPCHWLRRKIGAQFLEGLLVIVPIGIAVWILVRIFEAVDNFLQPVIQPILGRTIPGAGVGITIILIYLAGVLADNVIGNRLIRFSESLLSRVPVFRYVYTGIKNLVEGFTMSGKGGFSQVVLIEFPMKGMRTIAFVTGEMQAEDGEKLLSVYVPQAPTPTTGFMEIVREKDIVRIDMPVEAALKMVLSAGAFAPPEIKAKLMKQTKP